MAVMHTGICASHTLTTDIASHNGKGPSSSVLNRSVPRVKQHTNITVCSKSKETVHSGIYVRMAQAFS